MTNKEVIKMLTAKAECMRRETSGIDIDCKYRNCDECDLCYKQGTTGDQMEALRVAISALQAQNVPDTNVGDMVSRQKAIDALCSKCTVDKPETCSTIQEGDRWCEEVYTLLNMPSAQPEIIRCKDCKWWSNDDYRECSSPNYDDGYVTPAGFYCGYAERRKTMHVIERTKKQRKTDGAAVNSRNYMSGMYNYTGVDGRIYQTEKRMPSSGSRYTRIRSKEELKHDADLTVTPTNIRKVERFFGGNPTPMDQIESKYGLQYDKKAAETYGDSVKVFQMLCDAFPMAKNYTAWSDILISVKDHKPVRTGPIKIIRAAGEKKELPSDIKPIYVKGDLVWTIYRKHVLVECDHCGGRGRIAADKGFVTCHRCGGSGKMESKTETVPAVAKCNIVSWYTKRLRDGTFDIMYELDGHGAFGKTRDRNGCEIDASAWRLQGGGNLFDSEADALKFAKGIV